MVYFRKYRSLAVVLPFFQQYEALGLPRKNLSIEQKTNTMQPHAGTYAGATEGVVTTSMPPPEFPPIDESCQDLIIVFTGRSVLVLPSTVDEPAPSTTGDAASVCAW